jgi:hypothetical protein
MIYETELDRQHEAAFAEQIEKKWGVQLQLLNHSVRVNRAVYENGRLAGFLEIKRSAYSPQRLNSMGGVFLPRHKWDAVKELCLSNKVPFMLAVTMASTPYFMVERNFDWEPHTRMFGRPGRNDAELTVCLPLAKFQKFEVK